MGKVVGLVGAASGKIGNIVYAVINGIQVARVYQPVVSNPKSGLQTRQRAKANLAGRISSFVPRTAIMGLGANNRARRGEFLRNILKKAVVVQTETGVKAKIDNPDVLFSKGSVILSVSNPVVAATNNTITVTLSGPAVSRIPADVYASMQTRLVAMVYDNSTQELVEVVTAIATKPEQGATAVTALNVIHPTGYFCDIYAVPMSTADGASVSISSELALRDDATIAAALSVNENAVIFEYGRSVLIATSQYSPTSAKRR